VLAQRIAQRFAAMRDAGLVEEVQQLASTPGLSRTAAQAIGYKEVLAALAGETTIDGALDLAERRTRSFARRQRMWFRRDPRIRWLAAAENPHDLAPALLAIWSASSRTTLTT
jgi:tRNA dimethylallyltransferase